MRGRYVASIVLGLASLAGCDALPRRHTESRPNYPDRPQPVVPVDSKDENPASEVWPLDLWLVEFEKRNGVDLHYRDQDAVNHTVIRPGPGPFDSEDEAVAVLRQIAWRNGLSLIEERPHVYALKRAITIR
jgi:hypothetical protein